MPTVAQIAEQVRLFTPHPIGDRAALELAIGCALLGADDFVECTQKRAVQAAAKLHRQDLALTPASFACLFSTAAAFPRSEELARFLEREDSTSALCKAEGALAVTLKESSQLQQWAKPIAKVGTLIALHLKDDRSCDECLNCTLGEIVRADARRIQAFRARVEDDGLDVLMACAAIRALTGGCASE
jgi:hypothetical protein